MEGALICGLTENLARSLEARRDNVARWWVQGSVPRAGRDILRRCTADKMAMWAKYANVRGEEASSEDRADLLISTVPFPPGIDGPQGTLADCMLPGPPVQHLRIDGSEQWAIVLGGNPHNQNVIDLDRVLGHELGHFWGIGHDRRGAKSLMAPTFSWSVWEPQAWDVEQIVSLYGRQQNPVIPGQVATYMAVFDQRGTEMRRYKLTEIEEEEFRYDVSFN